MFQIKPSSLKKSNLSKKERLTQYNLYENGKICKNVFVERYNHNFFKLIVSNSKVISNFLNSLPYDLSEIASCITLNPISLQSNLKVQAEIKFQNLYNYNLWYIAQKLNGGSRTIRSFNIKFSIYINPSFWGNYNFEIYRKKFIENLKKLFIGIQFHVNENNEDYLIEDGNEFGTEIKDNDYIDEDTYLINIYISHEFFYNSINKNFSKYLNVFENCLETFSLTLRSEVSDRIFSSVFLFPNEIKTSCEQYLLYFAQFLRDLGINATSDLKEEAGKVLFSVTPTDETEALDKIREALAVYLKLPESPIVYDDSFAAMRLQQQIENLQHSQKMAVREIQVNEKLLLAQSDTIREKNLTISQQQNVIENQNKIIEKISSKSVMIDSVDNKEEFKKVFEWLEIGESEELKKKLGIKFNPTTAIKSLRKKITGNDDEIISLNLNDEIKIKDEK